MKVLCFGDSNTFGYDPRSFLGSRYEPEYRWAEVMAAKTAWEVINAGQNGREIPRRSFEMESAKELVARYRPDLTVVMLGTNDLLQGADPDTVTARMASFLQKLPSNLFLIAPPPLQRGTWVTDDELVERSRLLGCKYRALAERLGIPFADAAQWDIELIFDGVHFSENGHHTFAQRLLKELI